MANVDRLTESPETEPVLPSIEETARDYLLSWRFSQGDAELHSKLFDFYRLEYPELDVYDGIRIHEITYPVIEQLVGSGKLHQHREPSDIKKEHSKQLDRFLKTFEEPVSRSREGLIIWISRQMVDRDSKFLAKGRPGEKRLRYGKGVQGLYESHVCHYGLEGNPTHSPVFDTLFNEVDGQVRSWLDSGGFDGTVAGNLVARYLELHPDKRDQEPYRSL